MDSVNTFLSGFKTITTPYDKVDHKARNIQNIINLIGGADGDEETGAPENGTQAQANGPPAPENVAQSPANGNSPPENGVPEPVNETPADAKAANEGTLEKTDDKMGNGSSNPPNNAEPEEKEKGEGIGAFLRKRTLKAAKAGEAERTTELPEGTYIMENIIRIGTVIIYIILLPLIPWYYVMKYSFRKMRHLYDNMFKPM